MLSQEANLRRTWDLSERRLTPAIPPLLLGRAYHWLNMNFPNTTHWVSTLTFDYFKYVFIPYEQMWVRLKWNNLSWLVKKHFQLIYFSSVSIKSIQWASWLSRLCLPAFLPSLPFGPFLLSSCVFSVYHLSFSYIMAIDIHLW